MLDEMIEALRVFGESSGEGGEKLKISVENFKFFMNSMGEKMLDH